MSDPSLEVVRERFNALAEKVSEGFERADRARMRELAEIRGEMRSVNSAMADMSGRQVRVEQSLEALHKRLDVVAANQDRFAEKIGANQQAVAIVAKDVSDCEKTMAAFQKAAWGMITGMVTGLIGLVSLALKVLGGGAPGP